MLPNLIPTNDSQMSACRDACDDVGSNAFPFSMVILTERSELEASTGKGGMPTSTRLPYLGQIREKAQGRKERGMGRNTHTHIQLRDMLQVPGHRVLLSARVWEGDLGQRTPKAMEWGEIIGQRGRGRWAPSQNLDKEDRGGESGNQAGSHLCRWLYGLMLNKEYIALIRVDNQGPPTHPFFVCFFALSTFQSC